MKSVYSAVRTGSLNKAVCASSLNGQNFQAQWLLHVPSRLTFNNSTFCPRSVVYGSQKNSDYFPMQYLLIGFCNRDGMCLLRGTN